MKYPRFYHFRSDFLQVLCFSQALMRTQVYTANQVSILFVVDPSETNFGEIELENLT
jgi:hypothetical protein